MNSMLDTIIPKSDQLNADNLIGGRTMTITITNVGIKMDEQPVAIHFDGDGGKPYKPGKSMRRVLVNVWGPDANAYVGRSLTLYRDDNVKFGGLDVGGIRISHMSHITKSVTMALTATKAQRRPFTVQPLKAPIALPDTFMGKAGANLNANSKDAKAWVQTLLTILAECPTTEDLAAIEAFEGVPNARAKAPVAIRQQVEDAIKKAGDRLAESAAGNAETVVAASGGGTLGGVENDPAFDQQEDDTFPGDRPSKEAA